ncbi:unnamed protein product [Penicillium roqueforti FM164]|uniref:Genomic scaffold, ProqFM164S01 n=1 Tax=Penicillium roqueforti (strain FM164) TaxID=1365484 RepID=W6Q052_PENRF|nr:unnamed protein product [Penicillium roqueforti FM164]
MKLTDRLVPQAYKDTLAVDSEPPFPNIRCFDGT